MRPNLYIVKNRRETEIRAPKVAPTYAMIAFCFIVFGFIGFAIATAAQLRELSVIFIGLPIGGLILMAFALIVRHAER